MFNFRLQSVLNYRKQLEGRIASEFADTMRQFNCEKNILKKLKRESSDLVCRLNSMKEIKLYAADISAYFLYIKHIKLKKEHHEKLISRIERELEEKRLKLIDAIKKRKTLEMIREKMLKEYRIDLIANERKELDELATSRYARNMKIEKIDNCL